jgi:hypothetical protein
MTEQQDIIKEALEHYAHYNRLMLNVATTERNLDAVSRFLLAFRRAESALAEMEKEEVETSCQ